MDCQSCEAMLLDLVCGELAPHAQSEVHAHLSRCAQCSGAFERLSAGHQLAEQLPMAAPPPQLSLRLMQAARAEPVAPPVQAQAAVPVWEAFFGWVRRFTSSHQVAMATVMVLIVAVGVLSLDQLSSRPLATGTSVVNPEHEGEAAPSAALQPAKPLDLKMDQRAGRIYAKGDRDENARARVAAPAGAKDLAPARTAVSPEMAMPTEQPAAAPSDAPRAFAEAAKMAAPSTDNAPAVIGNVASDSLAQAEGARPASQPAPPAAVSGKAEVAAPDDKLERSGLARGALPEKKAQRVEREAEPFVAAAAASGGGANLRASRGSADAIANPYAPAPSRAASEATGGERPSASAPTKHAAGSRASALLFAARSARALGHCDQAVVHYRTLVLSYSNSPEAASALLEGTACYDQLGQPAAATALLTAAERMPSLAQRAQQTLEARRAGAARRAAPAAAASAPAAGP